MSEAAIGAGPARTGAAPFGVKISPALLIAVLWCAWTVSRLLATAAAVDAGDLGDTDNHMRLAEWRDFLAGQDWFDVRQRRFVGPEGGDMHFSRLPDALMTGLYAAATPFLGARGSERFVLLFYPPLLHLAFLAATAMTGRRLAGERGAYAAVILAMMAPIIAIQFAPGRIDHHGLALALSMGALAFALKSFETPRAGAVSAILATLAAAVSLEVAPAAAAAFGALVMKWIASGEGRALRAFGAAMLVAAPAALFATLGPNALLDVHCDALAAPAAAALAGAGVIGVALSCVGAARAPVRFLAAAGAGAALALMLAAGYPHCLGGPFEGMDPLVREVWLSQVSEARSPFDYLERDPARLIIFYGFPIAALFLAAGQLARAPAEERMRLGAAMLFLAGAAPAMLVAIRGATLATTFALPPFAILLAAASRDVRLSPPKNAARFLALFLCASPMSYASLGDALGETPAKEDAAAADPRGGCDNPAALAALSALPKSVLLAPVNLGPAILTHTEHSIVAAPYHRNDQSIRAVIEFFTMDEGTARDAYDRSHADYLIYCPVSKDAKMYASRAPGGLAARLAANDAPDWLTRIDAPDAEPLVVYRRVRR